jgi:hypothetical protein
VRGLYARSYVGAAIRSAGLGHDEAALAKETLFH